jgi:alkylhydroperoxidase family enzyme
MAHLEPLDRGELGELDRHLVERYDTTIGFTPNSLLTMARRPEIVVALGDLITTIWRTGTVPAGLKALAGLVSSTSAGCRYCQAHEAVDAVAHGVPEDKVRAVWSFETSPLYDEAERAALRLARDAGLTPSAVTAEHFDELRAHFDEGEIVELLAAISLFGFLSRWNDSVATALEELPLRAAGRALAPAGWVPGKHRGGAAGTV